MVANYTEIMAKACEDELRKIASFKKKESAVPGWVAPAAGGAVLTALLARAERDRRMGKQMRLQSGY